MCSPPKVRFFFITKYLTLFTSIYLSTISIFNPQIWLLTSLSHSALLTSKISDISCPSILKKKKKQVFSGRFLEKPKIQVIFRDLHNLQECSGTRMSLWEMEKARYYPSRYMHWTVIFDGKLQDRLFST